MNILKGYRVVFNYQERLKGVISLEQLAIIITRRSLPNKVGSDFLASNHFTNHLFILLVSIRYFWLLFH